MSQMPQKKIVLKQGHHCWRHLRLYYFAETYLNGFLPTVVVVVFQLMFRIYLQDDPWLHISWVMSNNRCYHTGIQIHDFLAFEDHKHQEICSLLPVRKIKSNGVNAFIICSLDCTFFSEIEERRSTEQFLPGPEFIKCLDCTRF